MAKIIQEKTKELKLRGINITFIWVPGTFKYYSERNGGQSSKGSGTTKQ